MLKNLITITTCLIISMTSAYANVRVSPTKLELSQKKRIDSLNIKNVSGADKKFQCVLVKKNYAKKEEGKEAPYEPTKDLMATPVVFTVSADTTQLIRVIARQKIRASREKDEYRILIKELPLKPLETSGIGFLTALSVPIKIVDITKELDVSKK